MKTFFARLKNLFRPDQPATEIDAELHSHLQLHIDDNLKAGMSPEEARRDAILKLRLLRKSPGFTSVAILTLALGIGANTAIFSVVNSVLLRSLPFPHPDQLVELYSHSTTFDFPYLGISLPDLDDLRANAKSFSSIAASTDSAKEISASGDSKPQRVECSAVSQNFFPTLGLAPVAGRFFNEADMQPGVNSVIISANIWKDRFSSDPAVVGKSITLDGEPHTIVGVVRAENLGFTTDSLLFTAFIPTDEERSDRAAHDYSVTARLKPGVTVAQAQSELDTFSSRLAADHPDSDNGWSLHIDSLNKYVLGDARAPLAILFCAVGLVLVIACANVSNLFLSRGWARRREFAIRTAMGASRARLLRQLTVESILIALAGGLCAFVIASWTLDALRSVLPPEIPRIREIRIDSQVAWFTLVASLVAALLAGLTPALLSTRQNIATAIKDSDAGSSGTASVSGHNILRQLLVVGEVALAALLLIGATLAVRSFGHLLQLDLGFQPNHLVTVRLDFPKFRFANETPAIAFVDQVVASARNVPGVKSAAAGMVFPMSDELAETNFQSEDAAKDPDAKPQLAIFNRVTPDFFQTFGIPVLRGRDFNSTDAKGKPPVFIVNETLAKKMFGTLDAIGKHIATPREKGKFDWGEIVAVVGDVREASLRRDPKPQIYTPYSQANRATGVYLVVRSPLDSAAILPALQDRIWSIDKNQPITAVNTLTSRIAEVNASPRSQSLLLGVFGALGFVLALIGVYAVMSYLVSLQTHEIGVRMALGASAGQILRSVLARGFKLTIAGVAVGALAGLALTRFMSSLLYGVSPTDPATFLTVSIALTLVALLAVYIPARRAVHVDPVIALRYE
jgi:putative ABC transport system permease protein